MVQPTVYDSLAANEEFQRLAEVYSWDLRLDEAVSWPERLIRRVMDIGTLADILSMQQHIGRQTLEHAIETAPIGAFRPQSWTFWHYRLGLVAVGAQCPPLPVRRFA